MAASRLRWDLIRRKLMIHGYCRIDPKDFNTTGKMLAYVANIRYSDIEVTWNADLQRLEVLDFNRREV
jgi:hypothetical protein